jgi:hypothetical protein
MSAHVHVNTLETHLAQFIFTCSDTLILSRTPSEQTLSQETDASVLAFPRATDMDPHVKQVCVVDAVPPQGIFVLLQ